MTSKDPERTPDGRFMIINGRRWRATDPSIPESLRIELVGELMAARRAVRDAGDAESATVWARDRVQDAKVALGERGEPCWERTSGSGIEVRLAAAMRCLLRHRDPGSTICPSDAARVSGGSTWRDIMEAARTVATELAAVGIVEVRQGGQRVDPKKAAGPIRLARGPKWPEGMTSGQ